MKRVVVTGMAGLCPIGQSWEEVAKNLRNLRTGIRYIKEWDKYEGLDTRLGGPVDDFQVPSQYTRKKTRSMGRVALLATRASELALKDARLLNNPYIQDGRMGISYGSSTGSPNAIGDFCGMLNNNTTAGINANTYLKMMSHTTVANIGIFFGLKGRVYTTSSACTSGSQGIGYAYESIKNGKQLLMLSGGAEQLCSTEAAVFDILFATSTRNSEPSLTPRPFDRYRDGLVIGEGAGTLVLEELDHAVARDAKIYAEVIGYGTNTDGMHITQPTRDTMKVAMKLSLEDADLPPEEIGYISAHGTATDRGDIEESHATAAVFGNQTPISSLKSYTGHTLGACGALEAWVSISMMNEGWFHPTANLCNIDPNCGELDYIKEKPRTFDCEYVMSNNFAFGGVNTSLIFKRWH